MLVDILKKVYHIFRPIKTYTLEEYSQEIVKEMRERGGNSRRKC